MKHENTFSHGMGVEKAATMGMFDEILFLLNKPHLVVKAGSTTAINVDVKNTLVLQGWAIDPKVHPEYNLKVNAIKNRVALTVQTGNITRAFYDLLKFQVLYSKGRIDIAVLILPSHAAASCLGSNIANFNRVTGELKLFASIITVPSIILSFA